jgi:16S rRNA (uracil1498-N3)-methyltransferase
MARITLMLDDGTLGGPLSMEGSTLTVSRDEALHAVRVKRAEVGERVRLLDGTGGVGIGEVVGVRPDLLVRVLERRVEPPVSPRLEVWSATPKGPRLEDMIEQLSQVGAALWRPLETELGVVEPGEGKMERCRRVARESAKQCGRAWVMEIGEAAALDDATAGGAVLFGDAGAGGTRSLREALPWQGHACVRLLIGPEGGFTPREVNRLRETGAVGSRFGPHVMRIETAAVVGAGVILSRSALSTT